MPGVSGSAGSAPGLGPRVKREAPLPLPRSSNAPQASAVPARFYREFHSASLAKKRGMSFRKTYRT